MSNFLDVSGLGTFKQLVDKAYQSKFVEVAKSRWYIDTPFYSPNNVIKTIYKCSNVIPGYTKWILILNEEKTDKTFNAYYINNPSYSFSTFKYKLANWMQPWELFLSNNCPAKSVKIDY